jgi:hypothetical protein
MLAIAAALLLAVAPGPVLSAAADTPTSPGCQLLPDLEPSCGVILGAFPTSFGGGNVAQRFYNFNNASGSTLSAAREYKRPGQRLSPTDRAMAKTPGAFLTVTWKPTGIWADADGGDAQVNHWITRMARSIKKLGSTKIMLDIYHEPERSVSGGADCPSSIYQGSSGTPAQYRAMWSNVESIFASHHVTNVVWAIDYTGFSKWNCMIGDLWPGDDLVDWILWDPYTSDTRTFASSVQDMYTALTEQSGVGHDYLSKAWGLGEFGDYARSTSIQNNFYSTIKTALDTNEFPKLKLLLAFDAKGNLGDSRIAYNGTGHYDAAELANFNTLDEDPSIVGGRESVDAGVAP